MKIVSLKRRLAGTIIDKVLILFLFVFLSIVFCSGHPGAEFGTFMATIELGKNYNEIESNKTIYERDIETRKFLKENGYPELHYEFEEYEHYKTELDVYQKHILIFVVTNLLYYLLCESFFKASLGKAIFKCKIQRKNGNEISKSDVFIRIGILGGLLLLSVALQMFLNLNAYVTSILFWVVKDFTVLTKQQSLVDISSGTLIVKRN